MNLTVFTVVILSIVMVAPHKCSAQTVQRDTAPVGYSRVFGIGPLVAWVLWSFMITKLANLGI